MLDLRPRGRRFEHHRHPWAKHINPSLVLVQPRKTRPYITERLLMGRKESNQTNKIHHCIIKAMCTEPAIVWTHTCILQTNRQTYIQTNSVKPIEHTYTRKYKIHIAPKTSKLWLGFQIRGYNKTLFSVLIKNKCCGYSKEPSQWGGSFEHPKHSVQTAA